MAAFAFIPWLALAALPLAAVLASGLRSGFGGDWGLALSIAWATAEQALASTGLALATGLPFGLWMGALRARAPGDSWLRAAMACLAAPYAIPTVVAGFAAIGWLGRTGALARIGLELDLAYSMRAVIVAHVFLNAPLVALAVAQARERVPRRFADQAATLGAGPLARARWVIWPGIRAAFATSAAQTFALCLTSFALVLLLGGGPPVETLETAIHSAIRLGGLDFSAASKFALLELAMILPLWVVAGRISSAPSEAPGAAPGGGRISRVSTILTLFLAALPLAPYLILAPGLNPSVLASSEIAQALAITLALALGAAGLATLWAAISCLAIPRLRGAASRSLALSALALPAGFSSLVLGLGFWLLYGQWVDPFEGSLAAMIGLTGTLAFPTALRLLWPVASRPDRARLEAARVLGASPSRAFRFAEWPRWRGPLLAGFALAFGCAAGEAGAVSLFYSERLVPLPLLLARWTGQYRFEEARALALFLLFLAAGSAWLVSWRRA